MKSRGINFCRSLLSTFVPFTEITFQSNNPLVGGFTFSDHVIIIINESIIVRNMQSKIYELIQIIFHECREIVFFMCNLLCEHTNQDRKLNEKFIIVA